MAGIEDFMKTFGFTTDSLTIIIICSLVLLGNFAGGLFTNIIRSFGGPIKSLSLTKRTPFRLALVSELFLIIYIVYYHTVLVPGIETAQIIYWVFIVLSAPLLAAIGSQLMYIAFAAKIEGLKKEGRTLDRLQRQEAGEETDDGEEVAGDGDEE